MPRKNPLTVLMAVAATVLFLNSAFAQHCDSCNANAGGGFASQGYAAAQGFAPAPIMSDVGGGCATCDGGGFDTGAQYGGIATDNFNFSGGGGGCSGGCGASGGGCGGKLCGGLGGHKANFQAWSAHVKEINRITTARNAAWPKPFQCADRQLYFEFWRPMLQSGINANCLLSDHHFNPQTGELNAGGKSRLRSIAQNNPIGHKAVLIQNTGDQMLNSQRQTYVQQVVNDFYGGTGFSQVAVSNSFPVRGSGQRIENVNRLGAEALAPPVIPVASGTGSTTEGISQ